MKTTTHSIKCTDQDWQTVQQLATQAGLSVNQYLHRLLSRAANDGGYEWQGKQKRGRKSDLERNG